MATKGRVDRKALEAAKRASVGQLLMKCARLLNERAMAQVNAEAGRTLLKPSVTALLPHIDFEQGTRLTELARRTGVSKQAVAQVVDDLERDGFIERLPDPDDSRAKRIRFTPRGAEAIGQGLSTLRTLEGELEQQVGARTMKQLHAALLALEGALTAEDA